MSPGRANSPAEPYCAFLFDALDAESVDDALRAAYAHAGGATTQTAAMAPDPTTDTIVRFVRTATLAELHQLSLCIDYERAMRLWGRLPKSRSVFPQKPADGAHMAESC